MVGPSGSAFDGHGPGGALEQVDGPWRGRCLEGACAAPAEQLLSGNVRIILKNRDFHPKKIRVRSGTTLTICSRDPFFHKLFSYTRYNRFGVRKGIPIRTGGCLKVKVVNPTAAPLPVVISDEIHSFERLRVNVLPAERPAPAAPAPEATAPITTPEQAVDAVTGIIQRNAPSCGIASWRISASGSGESWQASAQVTGNTSGTATWAIAGRSVTASDQLAARIAAGCP
jgi:hypothetical protein